MHTCVLLQVENSMTSVERMLEYTDLPQEPPRVSEGGGEPPKAWPESGALQWEGVSSRYRLGLPLVLKVSSASCPTTPYHTYDPHIRYPHIRYGHYDTHTYDPHIRYPHIRPHTRYGPLAHAS